MVRYDIKQWLEKQRIWLQEAAIRLCEKKELNDRDVIDLISIIKEEKSVVPNYSKFIVKTTTDDDIRLASIENPQGIDKLNPRTPLDFGVDNLSIVYGHNGSGKSGYVRILKKACGKINNPLKYNVYEVEPTIQSCTLRFLVNQIEKRQEWDAKGSGVAELQAVDIFDEEIGYNYLEQEKEATYAPHELTLFISLVKICERVNSELENEKNKLVSKLPQLPQKYKLTQIGIQYNNLSQKLLSSLAVFHAEDEKELKDLQERVTTSDASMQAKKLRETKKQVESIITLLDKAAAITNKEYLANFKDLYDTASRNRQRAEDGIKVLGDAALIEGVGSDSWKSLWQAAREYSSSIAYKKVPFPNTENQALCVLCHQELNNDAKERLQHFESYIKGKLETDATAAEEALNKVIQNLPRITDESEIRTKIKAAELGEMLGDEVWGVFKAINDLVTQLNSKTSPKIQSFAPLNIINLVDQLQEIIRTTEEKAVQFDKDAKSFDREKAKKRILELEAKQWTSQQSDAMLVEIERQNELEKYDGWMKYTNTRVISKEAGIASEKLITDAYVARFNQELIKLGASKITVELVKTRNQKGKGKYRIQLKNVNSVGTNPSDILSDGERRIVALAAFLADVTGKPGKVPFIFDDPISSLDQEYEERTAMRLIELAKERQVVVFTHRLSFLSILTDRADKQPKTICINSEFWGTGNPSDTSLNTKKPKGALNKLKNERVAQARKVITSKGAEEYNIYAQAICSDFRKLIERIVEIDLLADVVQRHRRAINTQGKIHKLANIEKSDCDLIEEMMTKYSAYEHSQSNEAPLGLPMPDELEVDIAKVIDWLEDFLKREPKK